MKTLPLGDSGMEVSALCLGAMNFGTRLDEKGSFVLLDRYFESGGRFIDTANNYAGSAASWKESHSPASRGETGPGEAPAARADDDLNARIGAFRS
jgi:aryl-alcohol dehydrogenase-like predicted oxidoreductase